MDTKTQNTTNTETQGSGVAKTIRLAAESFTKLALGQFVVLNNTKSISVDVVISDDEFIEITADDNLIDLIELSYNHNFLRITLSHHSPVVTKTPILIKVSTAVLKEVNANDVADIKISNINQDSFIACTRGVGGINLAGDVHHLTLHTLGAGDIDAKDLRANVLFASIHSSGNITSTCVFDVTTTIGGSGNITVYKNRKEVEVVGSLIYA